MELDDESKLDMPVPIKTDFPPGLCICLTHEQLEKLGLDHPDMSENEGPEIVFKARAKVTHFSGSAGAGGHSCRTELQIQDMKIVSDGDADD